MKCYKNTYSPFLIKKIGTSKISIKKPFVAANGFIIVLF